MDHRELVQPVGVIVTVANEEALFILGQLAFSTVLAVALILLPLVFYYLFQLLFGGLLIPYWSNRIAVSAGQP